MALDLGIQAKKLVDRFSEIQGRLGDPAVIDDRKLFTELNRNYKALEKPAQKANEYIQLLADVEEWELALEGDDPEMKAMAQEELLPLKETVNQAGEDLKLLLVPPDPNDLRNCLLEIRAGTGGDEASIFAGDLYRMYRLYIESQGWKIQVLSMNEGTSGGFKEVICSVSGEECYGRLRYESGVHRVQRVPATESQGRVHTSAASVVIMAEAEEVDDIDVNETELRIDTYRSSGAGGQHVNTTDSAIRITHIPTGLVVTCQDERSQMKNKARAMSILKSKLLDMKISEQEQKDAAARKSQVGTGDRSAKIRTYNFPQGRVTDHRINLTLYKLDEVIKGDLAELIDSLRVADNLEKLKQLENESV